MEYTKKFNELKTVFTTDRQIINIPDSQITINNIGFTSEVSTDGFSSQNDGQIPENYTFSYPVFVPGDRESKKVILLLHGLNERSWVKYLTWAYYLSLNTNSYVILFPISFHINRSPSSWKDPRKMIPFQKERISTLGDIEKSSFANTALSHRLTEEPMRFFNSGYQTANDIIKLMSSIREGKHEIVPQTNNVDVFSYSIGAFLSQIMFMGNPGELFSGSKLFIFCGGSVFSRMKGSSKLIMDSLAFDRVYNFYMYEFEKTITGKSPLVDFLRYSRIGMSFRAMIDLERFKILRENMLRNMKDQIHSLALAKDTVIPSDGILSTMSTFGKKGIVDVWDFPYEYSHENPFPVFTNPLSQKVDYWFEKVFSEAVLFLA